MFPVFSGVGWDQVSSQAAEGDGQATRDGGTVIVLRREGNPHRRHPGL